MQRQGDSMMSKWAEVMTNMRPKTYFLRPDVALQMSVAILREVWAQKIMGKPDLYATRGKWFNGMYIQARPLPCASWQQTA